MKKIDSCTHPACSACKHQRKKCKENCILAPYFPTNRSHEFHAVHKIIGVGNLTKMMKNVKDEDRRKVVDSLIWEAFCRQKDPILGSYGEYRKIYDEYKKVFDELMIHKNQIAQPLSSQELGSVHALVARNIESKGMNVNNVVDSTFYAYNPNCSETLDEIMRSGAVIRPFQHHSHQYFNISDQLSQMSGKSIEGDIWKGDPELF